MTDSNYLFLVRHGETDWNAPPKRFQGKRDVPLNNQGLRQAECLSLFFKEENIAVLYSSPLHRAYQTAEIISRFHNVNIELDERLVEMDFGVWEGMSVDKIQRENPEMWVLWNDNPQSLSLDTSENLSQLVDRSMAAIRRINEQPGRKKIIVTHGAFLRAAMLGFTGRTLSQFNKIEQANASINVIAFTPEPVVIMENYTGHLDLKLKGGCNGTCA